MTKWVEVKSDEFETFDKDEFSLFKRIITENEEYELRWKDKRRVILSISIIKEFIKYLEKHCRYCKSDAGVTDDFIEEAQTFLNETHGGRFFDDESIRQWAECYIYTLKMDNNWRKFKTWKNKKKYLKKTSRKNSLRRYKVTIQLSEFRLVIYPNDCRSTLVPADSRYNSLDFEFIADFKKYLTQHCKHPPAQLKSIVVGSVIVCSQLKTKPFSKEDHLKLWNKLYPELRNNYRTLKKYYDWRKKAKYLIKTTK
ncbi:hypothetical protein [Pseudoalteromonas sp. G4]|uniref:hypothetical protein n=1 Tax=Pseudoalteromonas sp. G4 TaxID=2992761 RepID=UPI00237E3F12|nr:hypothetical protein [Pseudoalteromonas sp. G4]MDE3271531.1 hypothetical protein [Pseudoalteromonas sp. G4]